MTDCGRGLSFFVSHSSQFVHLSHVYGVPLTYAVVYDSDVIQMSEVRRDSQVVPTRGHVEHVEMEGRNG